MHRFGPAGNLRHERVEDPEPGTGQVRIAVRAAGVHLVDTRLREGVAGGPLPLPELPTVPGREVAGVVDAVGPDTDPGWVGRRVVAHLGAVPGGYAELAVTGTERLHAVPDGLDEAAAVAMIGTGRTAMGLLRPARLTAGDVVLVTAAAGGIGTLLTQSALRRGATVVGLAGGAAKTARVRELGAAAVDYREPGWPRRVREVLDGRTASVVFDAVGGATGRAAVELLGEGGRHIPYGWFDEGPVALGEEELARRGITSYSPLGAPMMAVLRELEEEALAEAAAGRLVPAVRSFPLAEAAEAHRALESRATMGKVVLCP
nr:zinc-binding dehydrogenase [Streptomyces sp. SID5468]